MLDTENIINYRNYEKTLKTDLNFALREFLEIAVHLISKLIFGYFFALGKLAGVSFAFIKASFKLRHQELCSISKSLLFIFSSLDRRIDTISKFIGISLRTFIAFFFFLLIEMKDLLVFVSETAIEFRKNLVDLFVASHCSKSQLQ